MEVSGQDTMSLLPCRADLDVWMTGNQMVLTDDVSDAFVMYHVFYRMNDANACDLPWQAIKFESRRKYDIIDL